MLDIIIVIINGFHQKLFQQLHSQRSVHPSWRDDSYQCIRLVHVFHKQRVEDADERNGERGIQKSES